MEGLEATIHIFHHSILISAVCCTFWLIFPEVHSQPWYKPRAVSFEIHAKLSPLNIYPTNIVVHGRPGGHVPRISSLDTHISGLLYVLVDFARGT